MYHPALGDDFSRFLNQVRQIEPLSREREYALAVRYRETGDPEAAQELVVRHLPFVVRIAFRYRHYHVPLLDLVQEGVIGLMKAVQRFDPFKGYRLATFAIWWIRAYIQNFIIKFWSMVKLGTTQAQRKLFYHLRKTDPYDGGTDRESHIKELARELEVKEDEVIEMEARLHAGELSLDAPLAEDGELTLMDRLPDPSPDQEELLETRDLNYSMSRQVSKAIESLDPREKFVISKRYLEDPPWTLRRLGEHFGVTRERVRQLERRALNKLRRQLLPLQEQALPA